MLTLTQAQAQIEARLPKKTPLIVALDGRSAAGKTTFANRLVHAFGGSVIHMDDFFLPAERFTPDREPLPGGNIDEERFVREVLTPLQEGSAFCYRPFSCKSQSLLDPVPVSGPLIVVEGAYALLPRWGQYYDLALFLTVTAEEQQGRLLLRNGAKGMVPFLQRWIPREERYFAACSLPAPQHLLIDGAAQ